MFILFSAAGLLKYFILSMIRSCVI